MKTSAAVLYLGCTLLGAALPARAQGPSIQLTAALHDVVRLAPDAQIVTITMAIGDASSVVFDAVSPVAGWEMVITSPSGQRLTTANVSTLGATISTYSVTAGSDRPLIDPIRVPGEHTTVTIPHSAEGTWQLEFTYPSGRSDEVPIAVAAFMRSTTVAALLALPMRVKVGDPVVLSVAAFSAEEAVSGATIEATAIAPTTGAIALLFKDDGVLPDRAAADGLYTSVFVPAEPGEFNALAAVTFTNARGTVVQRDVALEFVALPADRRLIANAGADRMVRLGSLVRLSGSGRSEPDSSGRPIDVLWTLKAGAAVTLVAAETLTPTFTASQAGTYEFGLVISDSDLSSPEDLVRITVPVLGDVNGDGVVDSRDLRVVLAARNTDAADANDVRDLNGDGVIDALDARLLTTLCTDPRCSSR